MSGGTGAGHLDVVGTDGRVACSSLPAGSGAARADSAAAWLPTALRAARLTGPVPDARTGRQALVISTPIPGGGLVAAFVDLPALGEATGQLFGGARRLEFLVTAADG